MPVTRFYWVNDNRNPHISRVCYTPFQRSTKLDNYPRSGEATILISNMHTFLSEGRGDDVSSSQAKHELINKCET